MQTEILSPNPNRAEFQAPPTNLELGEVVQFCSAILIPRHRPLRQDEQRLVREMLRPFVVRGEVKL